MQTSVTKAWNTMCIDAAQLWVANDALRIACERGDVPSVRNALADGADPDVLCGSPKFSAMTVLLMNISDTTHHETTEAVRMMLDAGADASDLGTGDTLVVACNTDNEQAVRLLMDAGADPTLIGTNFTLQHSAISANIACILQRYKGASPL